MARKTRRSKKVNAYPFDSTFESIELTDEHKSMQVVKVFQKALELEI